MSSFRRKPASRRAPAASKYLLLERLAQEGVRGLYDLASRAYGYSPGRKAYLNHCDLCTDIRSFLIRTVDTTLAELAPDGFYAKLPPAS